MIGKSLHARHVLSALPEDQAVALLGEALPSHGKAIVEVRAKDARMIACVVLRADEASVRACKTMGLDVSRGASVVFGLLGQDAARLVPDLTDAHRAWLAVPCGPRETKVLLFAGGRALVSIDTTEGKATLTAASPSA